MSSFGRPEAAVSLAGGAAVAFVGFEPVELLERVDDVGDVEEAVAFEADVDERRLHAGEDLRDAALVDVADDAALPLALDEDLGHEVVLEDGHYRLVAIRGDDHLLVHSRLLSRDRDSGLGIRALRVPNPKSQATTRVSS